MRRLFKINKDAKISNSVVNNFNSPTHIYLPLEVNEDTYIYKNSIYGNYISSISGYAKSYEKVVLDNKEVYATKIINDYKENVKDRLKKKSINNKEELLSNLSLLKYTQLIDKITKIKKVDNLVITNVDEDDYSCQEFIILAKNYVNILDTIDALINIFNIDAATLAIKNTNYSSIKNVKSILGTYPNIEEVFLPDKYLISYPLFLCEYLNLNVNNTIVLTTYDCYLLYNAINSKFVDETIITISGNGIEEDLIVKVKLFVSLKEILDKYNVNYNDCDIYYNGVLQGFLITDLDKIVITMNTTCIVINKKKDVKESKCINCGACMRICPFKINVKKCYFKNTKHKDCISCGLCSYICPANIDLKKVVGGNNEKE